MNAGPVCGVSPEQPLNEVLTSSLKALLKQLGRNGGPPSDREVEIEAELARRGEVE